MASSKDMTQILGLMLIVVIALGLTPTIITSSQDAQWGNQATEYKLVDSAVSNITSVLAHAARYSVANTYFTIVIVAGGSATVSEFGVALIDRSNYTYSNSTLKVTFDSVATGPFSGADDYNCSITYSYALDAAPYALVGLVPLLWVVLIIAAVVVVVTKKLKMW